MLKKTLPPFQRRLLRIAFLFILAPVFLIFSALIFYKPFMAYMGGATAEGVVLSWVREKPSSILKKTYPEVQIGFETPDGQKHQFNVMGSTSSDLYKVGESVKVYYDPAHPEGAIVAADLIFLFVIPFFTLLLLPTFLTVIRVKIQD